MLSICVQAGGKSLRMGKNKALIPFRGEPLIQRIVHRVEPLASEIFIIANQPDDYYFLNLPIYPDVIPGKGALGGLYSSLSYSKFPFTALIACDMPFVNITLLKYELDWLMKCDADVVIPQSSNGLEPFHALYRREICLHIVQKTMQLENLRLTSWFDQVIVRQIPLKDVLTFDPDQSSFININTPEDLSLAESLG